MTPGLGVAVHLGPAVTLSPGRQNRERAERAGARVPPRVRRASRPALAFYALSRGPSSFPRPGGMSGRGAKDQVTPASGSRPNNTGSGPRTQG